MLILLEPGETDFFDQARCKSHYDPADDIYFPEADPSLPPHLAHAAYKDKERRAVAVCAGCPVAWECLSFAQRHHIRYGVWGGKTADERKWLRPSRMKVKR